MLCLLLFWRFQLTALSGLTMQRAQNTVDYPSHVLYSDPIPGDETAWKFFRPLKNLLDVVLKIWASENSSPPLVSQAGYMPGPSQCAHIRINTNAKMF